MFSNDVISIRWNAIKEKDLDPFHDLLVDIYDREYTFENMIEILKLVPKYLVVEACNWGFDTEVREKLHTTLSDVAYRGLIEDPNFMNKNVSTQQTS